MKPAASARRPRSQRRGGIVSSQASNHSFTEPPVPSVTWHSSSTSSVCSQASSPIGTTNGTVPAGVSLGASGVRPWLRGTTTTSF